MRSLWTDPDFTRYPALERDIEVEVAIIGGGLSGLGAAHGLTGRGMSVALLEARSIGSGASGRNAGFLLHGPAMPFGQAVGNLGWEEALRIWRFTEANNRLMVGLLQDAEGECGYLRRGSMSLAASSEELAELADTHAALADAGIDTCPVRREDLPAPFDELYQGGLWYPGNGEIDPAAFLRIIASLCESQVSIFEGTPVAAMRHNGIWELEAGPARIRAEQVVLATNAYTTTLLPDIPIEPKRGQVLATGPLDTVIVPFPMYADRGFQYWRQTPEGRLVVGGWRDRDIESEVGLEERLHDTIQDLLDTFCARVTHAPAPVEHRWSGAMGFTPDHLPVVGPLPHPPGLWIAAGYSGHGVCMAFLCGHRVGQAVSGQGLDVPDSFRPTRPALAAHRHMRAAQRNSLGLHANRNSL